MLCCSSIRPKTTPQDPQPNSTTKKQKITSSSPNIVATLPLRLYIHYTSHACHATARSTIQRTQAPPPPRTRKAEITRRPSTQNPDLQSCQRHFLFFFCCSFVPVVSRVVLSSDSVRHYSWPGGPLEVIPLYIAGLGTGNDLTWLACQVARSTYVPSKPNIPDAGTRWVNQRSYLTCFPGNLSHLV